MKYFHVKNLMLSEKIISTKPVDKSVGKRCVAWSKRDNLDGFMGMHKKQTHLENPQVY